MNDREQTRLQRARAFDRDALAAIYNDYYQPIYRYIYRQVGQVDPARDLTAEVFQHFLQAIRQGNGPDQNINAWLYRLAHNIIVDYYRRQRHRQHLALDEEMASVPDDDPTR